MTVNLIQYIFRIIYFIAILVIRKSITITYINWYAIYYLCRVVLSLSALVLILCFLAFSSLLLELQFELYI